MPFFDHNATTPLFPEAREAWLEASDRHWLNPSSPYRGGAAVRARLEDARERLAALLSVDPQRLIFNSGATEGNNAVFAHWAEVLPSDARIGVSTTEHPSVLEAARKYFPDRIKWLQPETVAGLGAGASGCSGVAALSVMAANNETGAIHPWMKIAQRSRESGILYHCDASQWIGKMPLEGLSNCDFVTGCAHKLGGPKGVGFLIVPERDGSGLVGGAQEQGRRAGTEDLPGILAMLAALEVCETKRAACSSAAKDAFVRNLMERLPRARATLASGDACLWNTASVILPEFKSSRWIRGLEKRGFLVSAGSACSAGKQGPSHVLAAMGLDAELAGRVVRISSGWSTGGADWEALLNALLAVYDELRAEVSNSNSQVISL
jgi:cysteine desulfurase